MNAFPTGTVAPGFVDIIGASAGINESNVNIEIEFSSLDDIRLSEEPLASEAWIEVSYRETRFDLNLVLRGGEGGIWDPISAGGPLGFLTVNAYRLDGSEWSLLFEEETNWTAEGNSIFASYPLEVIQVAEGNTPSPGESISLLGVGTFYEPGIDGHRNQGFGTPFPMQDEAFFADGSILNVPGGELDEVLFTTPLPVRFSNGEATTFHWLVEASNPASVEKRLELQLSGLEDSTAHLPAILDLEAGEAREFSVYVTVPFRHLHGDSRHLVLSAPQTSNELNLRIDYPLIAQPSGHHPEVFLHGEPQSIPGQRTSRWFNTIQDEEGETLDAIPYDAESSCSTGSAGASWNFELRPGLAMGVRAREGEDATLAFTVEGLQASPAGIIEAGFTLYDTTKGLATTSPSLVASAQIPSLIQGDSEVFELSVPWSIMDEPPQAEQNLGLVVKYCPTEVEDPGVALALTRDAAPLLGIVPGASARLPLLDYSATQDLGGEEQTRVTIDGADLVYAAPGTQVAWELMMSSRESGEYSVSILGPNKDNVIASDSTRVKLNEEPYAWRIAVGVPEEFDNAKDLEVIVLVENELDVTDQVAARLVIRFDDNSTRDDSAIVSEISTDDQDAPGVGAIGVLAALSIATARRNRTRGK